jgi:hypothetical protein
VPDHLRLTGLDDVERVAVIALLEDNLRCVASLL